MQRRVHLFRFLRHCVWIHTKAIILYIFWCSVNSYGVTVRFIGLAERTQRAEQEKTEIHFLNRVLDFIYVQYKDINTLYILNCFWCFLISPLCKNSSDSVIASCYFNLAISSTILLHAIFNKTV